MHLRLFDYFLWFVTPVVQVCVLLSMRRRKLDSLYPWFFRYTILQVVSVPILALVMYRSYSAYYYSYYVNLSLTVVLSLVVLYEASRIAFDRAARSLRMVKLFSMVVVLLALLTLRYTMPTVHSDTRAVTDTLLFTDGLSRVLQIALLAGLTILGAWIRVSRRSFVYGVVLGFGFFAFINMLVASAASHRGVFSSIALSRLNSLAYLVAVLIWLAYSRFGSTDPSGFGCSQLELPTGPEIRKSTDRHFKDSPMLVAHARS